MEGGIFGDGWGREEETPYTLLLAVHITITDFARRASWHTTEINCTVWSLSSPPQGLLYPGMQGFLKGSLGCFWEGDSLSRGELSITERWHGKLNSTAHLNWVRWCLPCTKTSNLIWSAWLCTAEVVWCWIYPAMGTVSISEIVCESHGLRQPRTPNPNR